VLKAATREPSINQKGSTGWRVLSNSDTGAIVCVAKVSDPGALDELSRAFSQAIDRLEDGRSRIVVDGKEFVVTVSPVRR